MAAVGAGAGHAREQCGPANRHIVFFGEGGELIMEQGRADGRLNNFSAAFARGADQTVNLDHIGEAARHRFAAIAMMGCRLRCGEAEGARLHRLADNVGHAFHLIFGRFTFHRICAHNIGADGGMARQNGQVDGAAPFLNGIHIFAKALKRPFGAEPFGKRIKGHAFHLFKGTHDVCPVFGPCRGNTEAAVADDGGCDAMPGGDGQHFVPDDLRIIMGVDIDKAGGNGQAGCVDFARRVFRDLAKCHDATIADADVALVAGSTGAINECSAGDFKVECHSIPPCCLAGKYASGHSGGVVAAS